MSITVEVCPRCGQKHEHMYFNPFLNPPLQYQFYGTCVNTNQPVLVRFRNHDEVVPEAIELMPS